MEVEKGTNEEAVTAESLIGNAVEEVSVAEVSEQDKMKAIKQAEINERNKKAEEQSRVEGFLGELRPLCEKWNVNLMCDARFQGVGANVQPVFNVGVVANPAK